MTRIIKSLPSKLCNLINNNLCEERSPIVYQMFFLDIHEILYIQFILIKFKNKYIKFDLALLAISLT